MPDLLMMDGARGGSLANNLDQRLVCPLNLEDYQVIVENLPQIFFMADADGKITYVNKYLIDYTGKAINDRFSKKWWESIIYPDDFLLSAKAWILAIKLKDVFQIECRLKRGSDETFRWHFVQAFPVKNRTGQISCWVGTCIDIDDSKMAEIKNKQMAAIVESSDDGIIGKKLDGTITTWNTGAEKLYGYKVAEIIGKSITILYPKDKIDEFVEIMEVIKMGEAIDHYQTVRVKKDGRLVDVSVTISPLFDRNGQVIGASTIARDIGQYVELERRKDAFIGMASHELKTPITTIKAYVQVLNKALSQKNYDQTASFLNKIDLQLNRLVELISDLLDISKIGAGKLELNKEVFDLNNLLDQVVDNMKHLYPTYQIKCNSKSGIKVYADKNRVEQVLINLITNAIKYSPKSKMIEIRIEKNKYKVIISVRDFGIGISKAEQKRIFERFYRAEGVDEKTFPGLGVGLYISSEIIKRHGGRILVSSKKGEGSKFSFVLPLK